MSHWSYVRVTGWNLDEAMSVLRTNHSFVSDLFNESVDLVHKTGLNDLFMNQNGI